MYGFGRGGRNTIQQITIPHSKKKEKKTIPHSDFFTWLQISIFNAVNLVSYPDS